MGPTAEPEEGRKLRRLEERHTRRYVSVFGELAITRRVYGTRAKQKIEHVPLDARPELPAGEYSSCRGLAGEATCRHPVTRGHHLPPKPNVAQTENGARTRIAKSTR